MESGGTGGEVNDGVLSDADVFVGSSGCGEDEDGAVLGDLEEVLFPADVLGEQSVAGDGGDGVLEGLVVAGEDAVLHALDDGGALLRLVVGGVAGEPVPGGRRCRVRGRRRS